MAKKFTEILTVEVSKILMPLRQLDDIDNIKRFLGEIGWQVSPDQPMVLDLNSIAGLAIELSNTVLQLISAETDDEKTDALFELSDLVLDIIDVIETEASNIDQAIKLIPEYINEPRDLAPIIIKRLLNYLLYIYLQMHHKKLYSVLHIIGIVEIVEELEGPIKTVHWDRIPKWIMQPQDEVERVYTWSTDFDGLKFLTRLETLLSAYLLPGGLYNQASDIKTLFQSDIDDAKELRIPLYQAGRWPESYVELDLNISPLQAIVENGVNKLPGMALYPYPYMSINIEEEIADNWILELTGNLDIDAGVGLKIRPPHNIEFISTLIDNPLSSTDYRLELKLRKTTPEDTLTLIFGTETGSHFGFQELAFGLGIAKENENEEIFIESEVQQLTLAINSSDGDGFIQKILSGINIKIFSDLIMGVSNLDGFYFRGSGGLEVAIPIHEKIGPIDLDTFFVILNVGDGFQLTLAASFGLELGPISGSVKKIGLIIPVDFPEDGSGNLGPLQIKSPKFKPPTGAGLSINSAIVGGGFLDFDDENKRYAGILALQFGEIGLVAIGLITTRMPDGSNGFSMLVNIGVTFDPPIQLSMGFTLAGVGGIIGINRSMDIDVLRAGIKTRTLDSILFPDPDTVIANANKIISDLRSVFPPYKDQFVVGPMIKIAYGTPALITADIGVFIEFPDPIRIVLMGQLEMELPEKKQPIISIHLDILGVLDFQKEELSFQASLYDSSILVFALAGDAAFLLNWGNNPQFAMSVGGFHPKFTPPPPPIVFGDMKRLSLSLSSGSSFQLTCQAYQALTSNSLQFGARVDLYARGDGFVVTGYLGFDALIYFSPFSFEVWIGGGVAVKYEGYTLAEIDLSLMLSGPTPWDARGKAKIKILFISVKVGFHVTWGSRDQKTLPAIDPWLPMQQALADSGNWSSVLPRGSTIVESLRDMQEEVPQPFIVHPAGSLEIRQKVAPLNIKLSKVGNAPVKDHDTFIIESLIVDEEAINVESVEEFFARGQVENLNAQQKLSVPAFEKYQGGVRSLASAVIKVEGLDDTELDPATRVVEEKRLSYESILLNSDRIAEIQDEAGTFQWSEAKHIAKVKHVRQAMRRAGTRKKFGSLKIKEKVSVKEELYCIAYASTLTRADLASELNQDNYELTRIVADQLLEQHLQLTPEDKDQLIVVPEYELEEAA